MSGRFGKQHRNRQRREAKAQMTVVTGALYVKPDSGCVQTSNRVELEDPDFRLTIRLVEHEQKLVEYAIVLDRMEQGEWAEVYSVDTCHGTLHEHVSGHRRKDDSREIRPMYTQVDVQESLDDPAMLLVLEQYRRMRS